MSKRGPTSESPVRRSKRLRSDDSTVDTTVPARTSGQPQRPLVAYSTSPPPDIDPSVRPLDTDIFARPADPQPKISKRRDSDSERFGDSRVSTRGATPEPDPGFVDTFSTTEDPRGHTEGTGQPHGQPVSELSTDARDADSTDSSDFAPSECDKNDAAELVDCLFRGVLVETVKSTLTEAVTAASQEAWQAAFVHGTVTSRHASNVASPTAGYDVGGSNLFDSLSQSKFEKAGSGISQSKFGEMADPHSEPATGELLICSDDESESTSISVEKSVEAPGRQNEPKSSKKAGPARATPSKIIAQPNRPKTPEFLIPGLSLNEPKSSTDQPDAGSPGPDESPPLDEHALAVLTPLLEQSLKYLEASKKCVEAVLDLDTTAISKMTDTPILGHLRETVKGLAAKLHVEHQTGHRSKRRRNKVTDQEPVIDESDGTDPEQVLGNPTSPWPFPPVPEIRNSVKRTETIFAVEDIWHPLAINYPFEFKIGDLTFVTLGQAYYYIKCKIMDMGRMAAQVKATNLFLISELSDRIPSTDGKGKWGKKTRNNLIYTLISLKYDQCPAFRTILDGMDRIRIVTYDPDKEIGTGISMQDARMGPGLRLGSVRGQNLYSQVLTTFLAVKKGLQQPSQQCDMLNLDEYSTRVQKVAHGARYHGVAVTSNMKSLVLNTAACGNIRGMFRTEVRNVKHEFSVKPPKSSSGYVVIDFLKHQVSVQDYGLVILLPGFMDQFVRPGFWSAEKKSWPKFHEIMNFFIALQEIAPETHFISLNWPIPLLGQTEKFQYVKDLVAAAVKSVGSDKIKSLSLSQDTEVDQNGQLTPSGVNSFLSYLAVSLPFLNLDLKFETKSEVLDYLEDSRPVPLQTKKPPVQEVKTDDAKDTGETLSVADRHADTSVKVKEIPSLPSAEEPPKLKNEKTENVPDPDPVSVTKSENLPMFISKTHVTTPGVAPTAPKVARLDPRPKVPLLSTPAMDTYMRPRVPRFPPTPLRRFPGVPPPRPPPPLPPHLQGMVPTGVAPNVAMGPRIVHPIPRPRPPRLIRPIAIAPGFPPPARTLQRIPPVSTPIPTEFSPLAISPMSTPSPNAPVTQNPASAASNVSRPSFEADSASPTEEFKDVEAFKKKLESLLVAELEKQLVGDRNEKKSADDEKVLVDKLMEKFRKSSAVLNQVKSDPEFPKPEPAIPDAGPDVDVHRFEDHGYAASLRPASLGGGSVPASSRTGSADAKQRETERINIGAAEKAKLVKILHSTARFQKPKPAIIVESAGTPGSTSTPDEVRLPADAKMSPAARGGQISDAGGRDRPRSVPTRPQIPLPADPKELSILEAAAQIMAKKSGGIAGPGAASILPKSSRFADHPQPEKSDTGRGTPGPPKSEDINRPKVTANHSSPGWSPKPIASPGLSPTPLVSVSSLEKVGPNIPTENTIRPGSPDETPESPDLANLMGRIKAFLAAKGQWDLPKTGPKPTATVIGRGIQRTEAVAVESDDKASVYSGSDSVFASLEPAEAYKTPSPEPEPHGSEAEGSTSSVHPGPPTYVHAPSSVPTAHIQPAVVRPSRPPIRPPRQPIQPATFGGPRPRPPRLHVQPPGFPPLSQPPPGHQPVYRQRPPRGPRMPPSQLVATPTHIARRPIIPAVDEGRYGQPVASRSLLDDSYIDVDYGQEYGVDTGNYEQPATYNGPAPAGYADYPQYAYNGPQSTAPKSFEPVETAEPGLEFNFMESE